MGWEASGAISWAGRHLEHLGGSGDIWWHLGDIWGVSGDIWWHLEDIWGGVRGHLVASGRHLEARGVLEGIGSDLLVDVCSGLHLWVKKYQLY